MHVCRPPSAGRKQYNEDCNTSSECDVTRGLCCIMQRRHRQKARKVTIFEINYSFLVLNSPPFGITYMYRDTLYNELHRQRSMHLFFYIHSYLLSLTGFIKILSFSLHLTLPRTCIIKILSFSLNLTLFSL